MHTFTLLRGGSALLSILQQGCSLPGNGLDSDLQPAHLCPTGQGLLTHTETDTQQAVPPGACEMLWGPSGLFLPSENLLLCVLEGTAMSLQQLWVLFIHVCSLSSVLLPKGLWPLKVSEPLILWPLFAEEKCRLGRWLVSF